MAETLTTVDGRVLASRLEVATSLWSRFVGLMGRAALPEGHGLWLANQVCDLVQVRSFPTGTVVRLHLRLS